MVTTPFEWSESGLETLMSESETHAQVGVFLSYAREDEDILQAVDRAFKGIKQHAPQYLEIFYDRNSITEGDRFSNTIRDALRASDYLIILYTGTYKKSHSFTGFEVGYFTSLMDRENQPDGKASRRIVPMYTNEPPATTNEVQGINLSIATNDLSSSREAYMEQVRANVKYDPLTRFFYDIADKVEERFPPGTLKQERRNISQAIPEIVLALRGEMYDCLSRRVARRSIEQRLITFELPKGSAQEREERIPDTATLKQHGKVFELFGIDVDNDTITWREFKEGILSRSDKINAATVQAIERAFSSAVSPNVTRDNEQIIRGIRDDRIYRLIVTQHFHYYDGRKVLYMYLIESMENAAFGDKKTAILLGIISICAKYRFMFIEPDSTFSLLTFQIGTHSPKEIQEKVQQLVRELLLIEEESRILRLDTIAAINTYCQGLSLDKIQELQKEWYAVRQGLTDAADVMLREDPASDKFAGCSERWLSALQAFSSISHKVNSTIVLQALDNLKETFKAPVALV